MKRVGLFLLGAGLVACAGPRPSDIVIEKEGVDMAQYQRDYKECEGYAAEVRGKGGEQAMGGAVAGGLIGAISGNRRSVEIGAGTGAVLGGVRGGRETQDEKLRVMKNCLRNRSYQVLN